MKISVFTKLLLAALLNVTANAGPVFTFSFDDGAVHYNVDSVTAFSQVGNGGHDWQLEKLIDSLSPTLFQALINAKHFDSAHEAEYNGAVDPNLLVGAYEFTDVLITSLSHPNPNTFQELVAFNAASSAFTAGPSAVPEPNAAHLVVLAAVLLAGGGSANRKLRKRT